MGVTWVSLTCDVAKNRARPANVEELGRLAEAEQCSGAGPSPLLRPGAEPCADRVLRDVERDGDDLALAREQSRPVPLLEEVADPVMPVVEPLRVDLIETAHPGSEVRPRRHHRQVVMVSHQAVAVAAPSVAVDDVGEEPQEVFAVLVAQKHRRLVDPSCADVIVRAGRLDSEWSSHPSKRTQAGATLLRRACHECVVGPQQPARWGLTPVVREGEPPAGRRVTLCRPHSCR